MAIEGATSKLIYVSMTILFIINWLNYVDRFTLVGKHHVNFVQLRNELSSEWPDTSPNKRAVRSRETNDYYNSRCI